MPTPNLTSRPLWRNRAGGKTTRAHKEAEAAEEDSESVFAEIFPKQGTRGKAQKGGGLSHMALENEVGGPQDVEEVADKEGSARDDGGGDGGGGWNCGSEDEQEEGEAPTGASGGRGSVPHATAASMMPPPRGAGRSARGGRAGMSCARCGSDPTGTKWYDTAPTREGGKIVHAPVGALCWACGKVGEAFLPSMEQEVTEKIQNELAFRKEFFAVRSRAAALPAAAHGSEADDDLPPSRVFSEMRCGVRLRHECALVPVHDFNSYFGVPADKLLGVKILQLLDEAGNLGKKCAGVLLSLQDIPSSLPRRIVELYSDTCNCIVEEVLSPADVLRDGHAQGVWGSVNRAAVESRDAQLKSFSSIPTHDALQAMVEKHQEEQEERQRQMLAAAAGTDNPEYEEELSAEMMLAKKARRGLRVPGFMAAASSNAKEPGLARTTGRAVRSMTVTPTKPRGKATASCSPANPQTATGVSSVGVSVRAMRRRGGSDISVAASSAANCAEDVDVGKILLREQRLGTKLNGVRALEASSTALGPLGCRMPHAMHPCRPTLRVGGTLKKVVCLPCLRNSLAAATRDNAQGPAPKGRPAHKAVWQLYALSTLLGMRKVVACMVDAHCRLQGGSTPGMGGRLWASGPSLAESNAQRGVAIILGIANASGARPRPACRH